MNKAWIELELTAWSYSIFHTVVGLGENEPLGKIDVGNTRGPETVKIIIFIIKNPDNTY